ncbi:unnamed protein product [Bursaphelenchus xylophilus]|uniref:(pine wood nematode) hypothetical protein n=1 Tax=Bursaphelenchus xylophilus TaxID=6326 RepID=A0A1I7RHZ4_BURXY|nr:unnamed protein product [Bursaphelenchus xylophilus]CAG9115269.1 unnamed protein product [Bursaphelenchus xylophilus]
MDPVPTNSSTKSSKLECFISADHVRPLISDDNKEKIKDDVFQLVAAGAQVMAEDLFQCAIELAQKKGRTNVTAGDVDACLANVLFQY